MADGIGGVRYGAGGITGIRQAAYGTGADRGRLVGIFSGA